MQERANVAVVRDAYRAFTEGNLDVLLECLADHIKWFASGPPDLIPMAGTSYGPEHADRYFSLMEQQGKLKSFEPGEFIAEGDKVVAIGELEVEVKATGSRIRSPWVHVFRLQRGKISEFRSFYDTAAVVSALECRSAPISTKKTRAGFGAPVIF